ncbi:hypothetical protein ACVIHI_008168 [Bradyrhizobium sp. USDA 4524]|uniref:hypothetical protein n=1 Tax=Bradyrhizobium TaxID=374 RepID=UPI001CE3A7D9|nr:MULTISPECIES: hypothetical protein [Bradyrhizobium]MCA6104924.1 hypothetical protein [Bradyrhizobium australafricanum]MCP1838915.1 hypothetical protein [Bradyrhizobium sp. USDA 4538]MCP1899482.1 hypothetical protein [Bradyrhizobium sp. USDA 4537]MCP1986409.1 hypothetical protein [Bradyrhizobium sp. USDA 4539]
MDRLVRSRVGSAGSVCNKSGIVLATAIAAWLGEHRPAVGQSGGSSDIGENYRARLGS